MSINLPFRRRHVPTMRINLLNENGRGRFIASRPEPGRPIPFKAAAFAILTFCLLLGGRMAWVYRDPEDAIYSGCAGVLLCIGIGWGISGRIEP